MDMYQGLMLTVRHKQRCTTQKSSEYQFVSTGKSTAHPTMMRRTTALLFSTTQRNTSLFPTAVPPERALVLGSSGALGRTVIHQLQQTYPHLRILGVDVAEPPSTSSNFQFCNVSSHTDSLSNFTQTLVTAVEEFTAEDPTQNDTNQKPPTRRGLDLIVCTAGGWAGDPPAPPAPTAWDPILPHALEYTATLEHMYRVNLHPILALSCLMHYADRYINFAASPLIVAMGATAALQPTPGMMGYGVSKAATHHVMQTMGSFSSLALKSVRSKILQENAHIDDRLTILTLLPSVLDTPGNRGMTDVVKTPLEDVAKQIVQWTEEPALRPHSGALIKINTVRKGEEEKKELKTGFHIVR